MTAAICRGRKPLYTFGCWFDKTSKQSKIEKMHQVLRALGAERLAAIPKASTADLDGAGGCSPWVDPPVFDDVS